MSDNPDRIDVTLLTLQDVAEAVGKDRRWIMRSVRDGTLPALKLGAEIRFKAAEVDAWLTAQKYTGPIECRQRRAQRGLVDSRPSC